MSDPKPVRTLELVRQELSQLAHQVGILEFQAQREIPKELEKCFNQMDTLNGECQKLYRAAEHLAAQTKAKADLTVVEPIPEPTAEVQPETQLEMPG